MTNDERLKMREFRGKQLSATVDTVRPVYYQVLHVTVYVQEVSHKLTS